MIKFTCITVDAFCIYGLFPFMGGVNMILRDFLKSPNKKKGVPYIRQIKQDLDNAFAKTYRERKDRFGMRVLKTDHAIYIIVRVPSESLDNIQYDVVVELLPHGDSESIYEHEVRVISNSPSFVFYHAYVYNKNGLLTDNKNLINSIPRQSIRKRPDKTNSYQILLYEKTTYYALKYLFEIKRMTSNRVFSSAKSASEAEINMTNHDLIMKRRKAQYNKEQKRKKAKEKREDKKQTQENLTEKTPRSNSSTSSRTKQSKRTKKK